MTINKTEKEFIMEVSPISFKQNPSTIKKIARKVNINNWSNETKKMAGAYYPIAAGTIGIGAIISNSVPAVIATMCLFAAYIPFLNKCSQVNTNEKELTKNKV